MSLLVVASTTVLGDIVENVVGDRGRVETLMPIGADPHGFQASARQAALLREADLVVVNGLGLEEGLQDVIAGAESDGAAVLEAGDFVEVLPFASMGSDEQGHAGSHENGDADPHIWLDPARMAAVVTGIGNTLAAVDPGCAEEWTSAARAYRDELLGVDAEVERILDAVPAERRALVTSHAALGYFADRYGFRIIGVVVPGGTTLSEPSAADLAGLVEVLEREGVDVIFAETTQSTDLSAAVAAELGMEVRVVTLHTGSLGEAGSEAETYVGMLLDNAALVAEALGG